MLQAIPAGTPPDVSARALKKGRERLRFRKYNTKNKKVQQKKGANAEKDLKFSRFGVVYQEERLFTYG